MKLTCQNETPELYPDNCATDCPVPDDCTLNSMAQGGVVFSCLPIGGKSCDCSTCDDAAPICGKEKSDKEG
jgi:hypothetical protein